MPSSCLVLAKAWLEPTNWISTTVLSREGISQTTAKATTRLLESDSCDIQACCKHNVTLNSIGRDLHLLVQHRVPHYRSRIPEFSACFIQPNDRSYNEPLGHICQLTYVGERSSLHRCNRKWHYNTAFILENGITIQHPWRCLHLCPLVDNLDKAKLEIVTCILLGIHRHLQLCLELS